MNAATYAEADHSASAMPRMPSRPAATFCCCALWITVRMKECTVPGAMSPKLLISELAPERPVGGEPRRAHRHRAAGPVGELATRGTVVERAVDDRLGRPTAVRLSAPARGPRPADPSAGRGRRRDGTRAGQRAVDRRLHP